MGERFEVPMRMLTTLGNSPNGLIYSWSMLLHEGLGAGLEYVLFYAGNCASK